MSSSRLRHRRRSAQPRSPQVRALARSRSSTLAPRSSNSCAGAHPPHRQRVRVARPLARVAPARPPPPARPRRPSPVPPPSKTTTTTAALTATTTLTTTTTTTTTKQQQQHQLQQQQQQQQQTQQHSERAYERESVASAEIVYFRGGREAGKAKQVQGVGNPNQHSLIYFCYLTYSALGFPLQAAAGFHLACRVPVSFLVCKAYTAP